MESILDRKSIKLMEGFRIEIKKGDKWGGGNEEKDSIIGNLL